MVELVEKCPICKGEGRREQTYNAGCGMGMISMMGKCSYCDGFRFVYKATQRPITESVLAQLGEERVLW